MGTKIPQERPEGLSKIIVPPPPPPKRSDSVKVMNINNETAKKFGIRCERTRILAFVRAERKKYMGPHGQSFNVQSRLQGAIEFADAVIAELEKENHG